MRDIFVETENVRKFHGALADLENRGAREACMVVVDGRPGLGKTSTMSRWVSQNDAVYIRAQPFWDGTMFIHNLIKELGEEPPRQRTARYDRIIELLYEKWTTAQIMKRPFGLVVDECDQIAGKREIMETIRGLSDALEMPTVLVGMGTLRDMLKRYPQIESRAPRRVRFDAASLTDVRNLIEKRCEVAVADDLVEFVHRASHGFNREVVEAIGYIERFGRRLEETDGGVSVADMAGEIIMHNRNTGQAVAVPGAY